MLPTVELGKTGLNVTRLGYGALELRDLDANGCLTGGGRADDGDHSWY